MKIYSFQIAIKGEARVYVSAKNLKEAKAKIVNEDWNDILDTEWEVDHDVALISIEEDEE